MLEILNVPEIRELMPALLPRVSVEEYHRLGEAGFLDKRTELIRGIIFNKMSRSPKHSLLASKLFKRILALLPDGYNARKEEPLTLKDSEPEPDISVMRGSDDDFESGHPTSADLVIEVAVTSIALDRANAALYAENGVKEYWIVLVGQRAVEVYRNPVDGMYLEKGLRTGDEEIVCTSVPQIRLRIDSLFS